MTGQSDLVNYIELIQGLQESIYTPRIKYLDRVIAKHYGIPDYKFKWCDPFPESEAEKIKKRKDLYESLQTATGKPILSQEEARKIILQECEDYKDIIVPENVPEVDNNNGGDNATSEN